MNKVLSFYNKKDTPYRILEEEQGIVQENWKMKLEEMDICEIIKLA